jgi:hypothetical protein
LISRWGRSRCNDLAPVFESSAFNRTQQPFRRIVLCFLERRLLFVHLSLSRMSSVLVDKPAIFGSGKVDGGHREMMADQVALGSSRKVRIPDNLIGFSAWQVPRRHSSLNATFRRKTLKYPGARGIGLSGPSPNRMAHKWPTAYCVG